MRLVARLDRLLNLAKDKLARAEAEGLRSDEQIAKDVLRSQALAKLTAAERTSLGL